MWDSDLNFKTELNIHDAYVYAIAVDNKGRLFSSRYLISKKTAAIKNIKKFSLNYF